MLKNKFFCCDEKLGNQIKLCAIQVLTSYMNGTFGCPRKVLAFSLSYCCCCYSSRCFGKRKWYLQLPFPRSLALQIVSKVLLVCSESWIMQPQIFSFTSNTFRDVGRSVLIGGHNLPPPPSAWFR